MQDSCFGPFSTTLEMWYYRLLFSLSAHWWCKQIYSTLI